MAGLDVELVFKEVDGSEGPDSGLVAFDRGKLISATSFQKVKYALHSGLVLNVDYLLCF